MIINEAPFQQILPSGSSHGVVYGLPKVRKQGCPFRSGIVNTYNYNLATYLVRILQPVSTNNFTIKDCFTFADWAKTYRHNQEVMCSFHVSGAPNDGFLLNTSEGDPGFFVGGGALLRNGVIDW